MELTFTAELIPWRGPAPFHFLPVPEDACGQIAAVAPQVSYGWGMIPAAVRIGGSEFTTALWPKDGGYLVPVKDAVRRAEELDLGDRATAVVIIDC